MGKIEHRRSEKRDRKKMRKIDRSREKKYSMCYFEILSVSKIQSILWIWFYILYVPQRGNWMPKEPDSFFFFNLIQFTLLRPTNRHILSKAFIVIKSCVKRRNEKSWAKIIFNYLRSKSYGYSFSPWCIFSSQIGLMNTVQIFTIIH